MSRLGLGLAALGRPGYINVAAYDGGVRYFDAARSYGKAEAFLASWLNPGGSPRGRRPRRPGVIVKEALANGRLTGNLTALTLEFDEPLGPEFEALAEQPARYWEKREALPWN